MDNMNRIMNLSRKFHALLSLIMVLVPAYYFFYWVFLNDLPAALISANSESGPLAPHDLPLKLRMIGLAASMAPLAALLYGLANIKKLFAYYVEGIVFSLEQVKLFSNTAKAIIFWVICSVLYESAKSVLFSLHNPPGQRTISVGFGSEEIITLAVGVVAFLISWVMEEGRIINEENRLTV